MGVMVVVAVLVLVLACVVLVVCVALIDQQRNALVAASGRLMRAIDRDATPPGQSGSRSGAANR